MTSRFENPYNSYT